MIKLEDIIVTKEKSLTHWKWDGIVTIQVEHEEPVVKEFMDPALEAKVDESVRNSILRYIYGDIVPHVHNMHKLAAAYLPTHIGVQFENEMDLLMDIFLGLPGGKKH